MKSTAKSEALIRDVADKLKVRFAGSATIDTVRITADSNGWPMIFLSRGGVETASNAVIAIRIQAQDAVSKDVFGNNLTSFAPHTMDLAYELSATANKPIALLADIAKAKYEACATGVRYQEKAIANTTAVSATSMDAATPIVDLDALYWPTKGV